MNILLYSNTFLPLIGGREIVVHYLAKSLQSMGHSVRVAGVSGWWRFRKHKYAYPVHRWPTLGGLMHERVQTALLRLECALWKTDIIHAHNTYPSGYFAAKVCRKNDLPLIITPHGMDIHVIPELGFGHRLDPEKKRKSDFALAAAGMTTAISENIKKSLNEAGVSDHRIRLIPNGIDVDRFERRIDIDIRKHYNLASDSQILLAVGNYHKRKGLEVLVDAMSQISAENSKARLLVVGRSSETLKKRVEDLGLEEKIILTGPIPFPALVAERSGNDADKESDLLAAIYLQSDIYVSASINEGAEGLSLALLDATAAGLAVVATDISGNRDIVTDGRNGFLVPPQNASEIAHAAQKIFGNSVLKKEMAKHSRTIASELSWHNVAKRYAQIYLETIEIQHQRQ